MANISNSTPLVVSYGSYTDISTLHGTTGYIKISTDTPSIWLDDTRIDHGDEINEINSNLTNYLKKIEIGQSEHIDETGTPTVTVDNNQPNKSILFFNYLKGNQGYRGFQGYTGEIGPQGYRGFQGYTGEIGPQGYRGYQGYRGFQGYRGEIGPQGYRGFQGYQGIDGTTADIVSTTDNGLAPAINLNSEISSATKTYKFLGVDSDDTEPKWYDTTYFSDIYSTIDAHNQLATTLSEDEEVIAAAFNDIDQRIQDVEYDVSYAVKTITIGQSQDINLWGTASVSANTIDNITTLTFHYLKGNQGDIGPQGYRGFQGYTGEIGPQGYRGFQGYTGANGTQGYRGFQGYTGEIGPQGYRGFQGYTGNTGPQGYRGYQGFQGVDGTTANVVSSTSNGLAPTYSGTGIENSTTAETYKFLGFDSNDTEPKWYSTDYFDDNITNLSTTITENERVTSIALNDLNSRLDTIEGDYLTSADTSSGPQGYRGFQGYTGNTGPQGYRGFQGFTGSTGPQGYRGYQGYRGTNGTQGYRGFQGFTGSTGPQGYRGYQGYRGTNGTQGYRGFQGFTGGTGSQGYRGFQGFTGSTGPQGYRGYQGYRGTNGTQGYRGFQGFQGASGNNASVMQTALTSASTQYRILGTSRITAGTTDTLYFGTPYILNDYLYYSSDARKKHDIKPYINDALYNAVDNDNIIKSFKFNNTLSDSIGVIAQEVMNIIPECVHYNEETDEYAVDYISLHSALISVLIQKINELRKDINKLL